MSTWVPGSGLASAYERLWSRELTAQPYNNFSLYKLSTPKEVAFGLITLIVKFVLNYFMTGTASC